MKHFLEGSIVSLFFLVNYSFHTFLVFLLYKQFRFETPFKIPGSIKQAIITASTTQHCPN